MNEGKINIDFNSSAVGDTVAFLPILTYLQQHNAIEKVYVLDYLQELFNFIVPSDQIVIKTPDLGTVTSKYPYKMSWVNFPSSIKMHLVDYASIVVADTILDITQKNYPKVDVSTVPNVVQSTNYVVLGYGSTYTNKKLPSKAVQEIIQYVRSQGIDVVLLGKHLQLQHGEHESVTVHFDDIDTSDCINLIDKTTLKQSIRVLQDAKCIIGLDNGLIHLAGLTDTPIVVGYSLRHPKHTLPIRHDKLGWNCYVVQPSKKCRYCMTESILPLQDFRFCATEKFTCTKSLTGKKFIKQIQKCLKDHS